MSDYNSSLPVRTESAGDVIVKVADASVPSQQLAIDSSGYVSVKLLDGAGNALSSTGGALHALVTATNLDIRDLAYTSDSVTAHQGGTWTVGVSGTVAVSATDLDIRNLVAATDTVSAHLKDESGNAYSLSNPLYVEMVSGSSGTEIHDYSTAAAVAAGATSNHDYTVAATTMLFKGVYATGSGKMKIEIQIDPDGLSGYSTKLVAFNSTATPNMDVWFAQHMELASGAKIRVIRTNKDNQAQDVYSTIEGLGI